MSKKILLLLLLCVSAIEMKSHGQAAVKNDSQSADAIGQHLPSIEQVQQSKNRVSWRLNVHRTCRVQHKVTQFAVPEMTG